MYNPGVSDMSGQFMAQGIKDVGESIADSIKTFQQNKLMASQALAKFEGASQADPEILKFLSAEGSGAPTDAVKAYQKLKTNGNLGVKEAAYLATFADGYTTQKKAEQERAARVQAAEANKLQIQAAQQQMEMQKRQMEEDARSRAIVARMGQYGGGAGNGVLAAGVQDNPFFKPVADAARMGIKPPSAEAMMELNAKQGAPGAVVTAKQIQEWKKEGLDVDAVPMADGRFRASKVSPFAPAPSQTVNLPANETSFGKEGGRLGVERMMQEYSGAQEAAKNIARIDETLDLLKNGDPTTGIFAEPLTNLNRLRAQFMADKQAGKKVSDTQVLDAMMGSEVFPLISALGLGSKGLDTPAEREFLRKVMTGDLTLDKAALIRMATTRRGITEQSIKTFNEKVDDGEYDKFFEATGLKKRTVGSASKPKSDEVPTPRTTSSAASGLSDDEEKRRAFLRAKLGK